MAHAAYCRNGHIVGIKPSPHRWSDMKRYLEADGSEFLPFCPKCGQPTIARCPNPDCHQMIEPKTKHCGGCGLRFPWFKGDDAGAAIDTKATIQPASQDEVQSTLSQIPAPVLLPLWRDKWKKARGWLWSTLLLPVLSDKVRQGLSTAIMWLIHHLRL